MPGERSDSVQENMRAPREKQKREALARLEALVEERPKLQRHVFFVPGLTDERNGAWTDTHSKQYTAAKEWAVRIFPNAREFAHCITFTDTESKACSSFRDFSVYLKEKIWKIVDENEPIDVVGHSMGGLDLRAAIVAQKEPLLHVKSCITVATPHEGAIIARLRKDFNFIRRLSDYHMTQSGNLRPACGDMKWINSDTNRRLLLERIEKLYCFSGTKDYAVFASSRARMDQFAKELGQPIEYLIIEGATHGGRESITQDVRTLDHVFRALLGRPLYLKPGNRGNFS